MKKILIYGLFCLVAGISTVTVTATASAAVTAETAFIFNTLSFLVHGFLVMWMAAGFCMLEAGLVRSKNTAMQCSKNIGLYSIAGIMYWLIGYNLMYSGVDAGYIGTPSPWSASDPSITADGFKADDSNVYSAGSDWFFQMVFVAAAGSIVSGTVAERVKVFSFLVFIVILTGVIYPIQGSWTWGGGWLSEMGFSDFAGSTIVHSVGGWAALTGALIIGARKGKYTEDGQVNPMPGANLPLATLGTFILWLGWFGFNGGSAVAANGDAATAIVVTQISAATAALTWMVVEWIKNGKPTVLGIVTGSIAGLAAITPASGVVGPQGALIIGLASGFVCWYASTAIKAKFGYDDSLDVFGVHGVGGIIGTLLLAFLGASGTLDGRGDYESGAQFAIQFKAAAAVGLYTLVATWIILKVVDAMVGLRVDEQDETNGLDISAHGEAGYND